MTRVSNIVQRELPFPGSLLCTPSNILSHWKCAGRIRREDAVADYIIVSLRQVDWIDLATESFKARVTLNALLLVIEVEITIITKLEIS